MGPVDKSQDKQEDDIFRSYKKTRNVPVLSRLELWAFGFLAATKIKRVLISKKLTLFSKFDIWMI